MQDHIRILLNSSNNNVTVDNWTQRHKWNINLDISESGTYYYMCITQCMRADIIVTTSINIIAGNNTITFNTRVDNTYNGDSVTVTDSAGNSSTLALTTFTIDTTGPTLTETT